LNGCINCVKGKGLLLVIIQCVSRVYVGGRSSPAYERTLNFVVGFFVMHLLIPFKAHLSRTR